MLVLVFLPELEQVRCSDRASCSVMVHLPKIIISIYAFLIFRKTVVCPCVLYLWSAVYRSSSFTVILFRLDNFLWCVYDITNHKKCDDKSAHSIDYNNQGFLRSSSGRCNNYFNELHVWQWKLYNHRRMKRILQFLLKAMSPWWY